MALSLINVGTTANDGTGDPLRTAFQTVNTAIAAVDRLRLANIAAMTALTKATLTDGDIAYVDAYATDGDNGGGKFYWDASSSATAAQGIVAASDEAGTGRWIRQFNGPVDVRYCGAVVSPTVSTTACAAAHTYAEVNGLAVYYPEGTWLRASQTISTNGATVFGAGKSVTTIKLTDTTNNYVFYATGVDDMEFRDFSIDGNKANNATISQGFRIEGASNRLQIVDVEAYNCRNSGISLAGTGANARIVRCRMETCAQPGMVTSGWTDSLVSQCEFYDNDQSGLQISGASHRWRVEGCTADSNGNTTAGAGITISTSDFVTVANCVARDNASSHGIQFGLSDDCVSVGNTCTGNGISGLDFFTCLRGRSFGDYSASNSVRGLEVDTTSTDFLGVGFVGFSNTDVDISIFRTANARLISVSGDVRIWDSANLASATINDGGSGYDNGSHTATLVGGTSATAAQFTVTVSGGAVTSVDAITVAGDYWTLPADGATVTGITGSTGALFDMTWTGENSNTCAGITIDGGMDGDTLNIVSGAAANVRISNLKTATVTDPGSHLVSAVACESTNLPFKNASLQNSWVVDTRAIYYKDASGIVHIEGRIKSGTTTDLTLLFTLDAGFRPANTEYFLCTVSGGTGNVYIQADGAVTILNGFNATWSTLNGISFRAE